MKRYSHLLISAILLTCATSALAGTDRTRQTAAPAVDTPAPSPTPAADAPATTPTPTTAKPVATNTPAAPDAPEPEKAQPAPVRLHVVRGSLFAAGEAPPRLPQPGEAAPAPAMSYTSVAPLEPKRYKKHDVITVIVREDSNSSTTANFPSGNISACTSSTPTARATPAATRRLSPVSITTGRTPNACMRLTMLLASGRSVSVNRISPASPP